MATPNDPINAPTCAQASPQNGGAAYEYSDDESEAPVLTGADIVPFTSRVIAAARAIESRRPDRLFDDFLAGLLAGREALQVFEEGLDVHMRINGFGAFSVKDKEKARENAGGSDYGPNQSVNGTGGQFTRDVTASRYLAIRTRFGDDFFEDCTRPTRNIKQIVSLGAGMDTRGYRLRAGPNTTVFEVDQAVVIAFKAKIISGSSAQMMISEKRLDGVDEARVVEVMANFNQTGWEDRWIGAGFDPALPSAWILEGLTMYLEEDVVSKLVQVIANLSSPGSALNAEVISAEFLEHSKSSDNDIFSSFRWGIDDPQAFFEGYFPDN